MSNEQGDDRAEAERVGGFAGVPYVDPDPIGSLSFFDRAYEAATEWRTGSGGWSNR